MAWAQNAVVRNTGGFANDQTRPNNVRCLGQFGEHILTRRLLPVTSSGPLHCDAERSRWVASRERCQQEVRFSWPWSFFEADHFHLGVGSLPTPVVRVVWKVRAKNWRRPRPCLPCVARGHPRRRDERLITRMPAARSGRAGESRAASLTRPDDHSHQSMCRMAR